MYHVVDVIIQNIEVNPIVQTLVKTLRTNHLWGLILINSSKQLLRRTGSETVFGAKHKLSSLTRHST